MENPMTEWSQVDTRAINQEIEKEIQGVRVKVSFSPYDVPIQFRGFREPNGSFFIIEFKYINDEKTVSNKSSPNAPIELEIGENSKRIYKIKVDVEKLKCAAVRLEIDTIEKNVVGAIHKFRDTVPEKLQERYTMPESIVSQNQDRLFAGIAG
jgi:hypothetical protein